MAGDDLLMAGPSVMPEALAGLFRSRPSGAVPNLIRKELRLLRPLWLITLLLVLYLTCLTMFGLKPLLESSALRVPVARFGNIGWGLPSDTATAPRRAVQLALFAPVGLLPVLIAILAGSLSLGEERTSGTHSWHMTLPVSARRQWLIKLVMAVFTGFVCAVLLPVLVLIAGGFIFGSPFMFVDPKAVGWPLMLLLLSFASFWCACAVNGTVRAVLWVFPVMGALFLVSQCGDWVTRELAPYAGRLMHMAVLGVVWRFDPFAYFRFINAISRFPLLFPLFYTDGKLMQLYGRAAPFWLAPTFLFAVIQSRRMFRTEVRDSTLSVIRSLVPLATVAFLCIFSLGTYLVFVYHASAPKYILFRETHEAIEKIQSGAAKLDATHPLQLTVEDLAKASPLSPVTRRLLRDSSITVAPGEPHRARDWRGGFATRIWWAPHKAYSQYLATIHLANGSDCFLLFQGGGNSTDLVIGQQGLLSGKCE